MIPGRRGVGGQEQNEGQVVSGCKPGRLEVEDRGDQHDAVQIHPVPVLQVSGQSGGPCGTVAFTD